MSNQVILEEEYDENYEPTEEEVAEYATLIGLDTVKDEHLMYIAREGVNAPLPKDWKPVQDVSATVEIFITLTSRLVVALGIIRVMSIIRIWLLKLGKNEAAPGAGDRASPVVGKKKKKGEGKKKKVKAGGPDSSSLGALAPLKSSGGLSPGGLAPLKSLGGLSSGAQKPSSLLTAPAALKGASMPLMSKSNETFGNVQMLSMSVSEEDSTTNLDGTSSMNFPGASHDYDSSGLELYTASATANKTDTLDNTTDLIKYGLKDIDQLEPVVPVGASTDMDVRESLDSYQSTPRNEPPRLGSRFLKSNQPLKINTQAPRTLPTGALSAGPKATPPVIKSIDESTAADTSEIPTTDGDVSPVRRSILAGLNPAESLDEQSHLLEGSESEQRGLALTGGLSVEPVVETDDDKRRRAAEAAEVKAALVAKETELKKGERSRAGCSQREV
ncbi:CEP164 [Bugula neritina]|uniref:CEP164 n=1 Tax=Bugula neritina TaxID=10212 RepID=A0A7J7KEP1_BUGNE|nr:CEP164 [Bugula neritina]